MSTLTIDDNDARISYTGGKWETIRGSSQQWQSTAHSTWDFSATATLTFTGTGIRVYGTVPVGKGTGVVDFSLNANTAVRVWTPSGKTPIYGKEMFYSGVLPLGTHTITMSNKGEDNDEDFELDRVVIDLESPPPSVPSPPPAASSASSASPIQPSSTSLSTLASSSSSSSSTSHLRTVVGNSASSSNSASSASSSAPSTALSGGKLASSSSSSGISVPTAASGSSIPSFTSSESNPVPKIVGSVIGVLLLLSLLLFLFLRRRRSKMKAARGQSLGETPIPFHLDHHPNPVFTPKQNQLPSHSDNLSTAPWSEMSEQDTNRWPGRPLLSLQIPTGPFREKYSRQTSEQGTSDRPPRLSYTSTTWPEERPPSYQRGFV